jgi:hypothetical protein
MFAHARRLQAVSEQAEVRLHTFIKHHAQNGATTGAARAIGGACGVIGGIVIRPAMSKSYAIVDDGQ